MNRPGLFEPGRSRRAALGLAASALLAFSAAGCGSNRTTSPVSSLAEQHLEYDVLDVMNHNGLPVMDSYIACKVIPNGHTQTCYGLTDDAPVQQIEGDFDVTSVSPRTHSCPGSLTVKLGGLTVNTVHVNPCL